MKVERVVKLLTPPVFAHGYRALRNRIGNYGRANGAARDLCLSGDYRSWGEAMADSTGYDAESILEKTKAALLKVKNGEAVYERDSVLFDEIQYSWPLVAGLMWVAAQSGGRLNVLDFGGALGSAYFQMRDFLNALPELRWNIVEQPRHVEVGKKFFEGESLRFYPSITDCTAETTPNVVILGSVLQYMERPYDLLTELLGLPCDHVIVDRTPFWNGPQDRLCLQKVPPSIYPASYPSWILTRSGLLLHLETRGFVVVAEFVSPDRLNGPVDFTYRGMIITKCHAAIPKK